MKTVAMRSDIKNAMKGIELIARSTIVTVSSLARAIRIRESDQLYKRASEIAAKFIKSLVSMFRR